MFGSFDDGMFEELNKSRQPHMVELDPGKPKPWRPGEDMLMRL